MPAPPRLAALPLLAAPDVRLFFQAASSDEKRQALALSVEFLSKNPLLEYSFAGHKLVAVTSPDGAHRVYAAGPVRFARLRPDGAVEDATGRSWRVTEEALVGEGAPPRPRVPARRAFWFGWHARFPETELVR